MTQFHQEEQKRFEELLDHYKASKELPNTAVNDLRRKPNTALEQELKAFLQISNSRAMKHILEELLAEIPECEDVHWNDIGTPELIAKQCETYGRNEEKSRQRASITKKLSDIALEE